MAVCRLPLGGAQTRYSEKPLRPAKGTILVIIFGFGVDLPAGFRGGGLPGIGNHQSGGLGGFYCNLLKLINKKSLTCHFKPILT
jgi:hypothetical protein